MPPKSRDADAAAVHTEETVVAPSKKRKRQEMTEDDSSECLPRTSAKRPMLEAHREEDHDLGTMASRERSRQLMQRIQGIKAATIEHLQTTAIGAECTSTSAITTPKREERSPSAGMSNGNSASKAEEQ